MIIFVNNDELDTYLNLCKDNIIFDDSENSYDSNKMYLVTSNDCSIKRIAKYNGKIYTNDDDLVEDYLSYHYDDFPSYMDDYEIEIEVRERLKYLWHNVLWVNLV